MKCTTVRAERSVQLDSHWLVAQSVGVLIAKPVVHRGQVALLRLAGSVPVDEMFAEDVRTHGWSLASINDHSPPFQYTIGLMHTFDHPELIIFGLDSNNTHALFSGLVREIRAGRSFEEPGIRAIDLGGNEHQVGFRPVHSTQHELYLGFAMGFLTNMGRIGELEAVQAFWPDAVGKFPFEVGCELAVYQLQPRLDIGLSPRELRKWRRQWE